MAKQKRSECGSSKSQCAWRWQCHQIPKNSSPVTINQQWQEQVATASASASRSAGGGSIITLSFPPPLQPHAADAFCADCYFLPCCFSLLINYCFFATSCFLLICCQLLVGFLPVTWCFIVLSLLPACLLSRWHHCQLIVNFKILF